MEELPEGAHWGIAGSIAEGTAGGILMEIPGGIFVETSGDIAGEILELTCDSRKNLRKT